MSKTLYAARVVDDLSTTTYLWRFGKDNRPGLRGGKRTYITQDVNRVMLRATVASIMDNIRDAEQRTSHKFEVVAFEVVKRFSAYTYGIQGTAAQWADEVEGAFVRTIGDYVYVLRAQPLTGPANIEATEGDVIVRAEDWAMIQRVIRDVIDDGAADLDTIHRLTEMKVSVIEAAR